MRIHTIEHVAFEDCANIGLWAKKQGHQLSRTRLYHDEPFPVIDNIDFLAVMGGPMNIYQHDLYPWLKREKEFIAEAIAKKKITLGICLGAQLISDVLGGKTIRNQQTEIGWYPVILTDQGGQSPIFSGFPQTFTAFHWHGDTFEIPPEAIPIASSEACVNQAFQYANHVVGLQFHLEYSADSIQKMLDNCSGELVDSPYIQSKEHIAGQMQHVSQIEPLIYKLLDALVLNKKD